VLSILSLVALAVLFTFASILQYERKFAHNVSIEQFLVTRNKPKFVNTMSFEVLIFETHVSVKWSDTLLSSVI
jgi:hypothetical protein